MSFKKDQTGFAAFEIIIVVAVVGILGFAGYFVYNRKQDKTASNSSQTSQETKASDETSDPLIKSTSDLDKAEKSLDVPDASSDKDSSRLDAEMNAF